PDLVCGIDHVIVGQDVTVGADDDAGAQPLLALFALFAETVLRPIAEELAKHRIVEKRRQSFAAAADLDDFGGRDADDRRLSVLDDGREANGQGGHSIHAVTCAGRRNQRLRLTMRCEADRAADGERGRQRRGQRRRNETHSGKSLSNVLHNPSPIDLSYSVSSETLPRATPTLGKSSAWR